MIHNACIQLIKISSAGRWSGQPEVAKEVLVDMKTTLYDKVENIFFKIVMIWCPEYICDCCAAMFLAVCYKAASEGPSVQSLRWCRT